MSDAAAFIRLVPDLSQCHEEMNAFLTWPGPGFFSRIGGSDTDVVAEYYYSLLESGAEPALRAIQEKFSLVKRFNGYYDKANDPRNIERFCRLMIESYHSCSQTLVGGAAWLTEFMPKTINPVFHKDVSAERRFIRSLATSIGSSRRPVTFYPYSYVEQILYGPQTLFRSFAENLTGKRVLAVTPFERSILKNFNRRQSFFKNYKYPEFELVTYNAAITYDGLPASFYPDADWFATLERMKQEIAQKQFDIALMACGAYTVPIGLFIRDALRRKAVYVGGCLQLYFGVLGRRFNDPYFLDQVNPGAFILPEERNKFLAHIEVTEATPRDAFGAYF